MLRQRLVRQRALNVDVGFTPSFEDHRTDDSGLFRLVSSDSSEDLADASAVPEDKDPIRRRHSIACGSVAIDIQKLSLKSAFNSAVRRMSNACSVASSTYSSQPTLTNCPSESSRSKSEKAMVPPVFDTFRRGLTKMSKEPSHCSCDSNRRFSTDFAPPSYQDATNSWKLPHFVKPPKFCKAPGLKELNESCIKKSSSESDADQDNLNEVVSGKA